MPRTATPTLLDASDLPALLDLQEEVLAGLGDTPWLRRNEPAMFEAILAGSAPHRVRGVWFGGRLAAAGVLYVAGAGPESIAAYVGADPAAQRASVNLKLILVSPAHRGAGLARTVIDQLRDDARDGGWRHLYCTIHPDNEPSRKLFTAAGYSLCGSTVTAYGQRDIYRRNVSPQGCCG